jgi:hypothetical protein
VDFGPLPRGGLAFKSTIGQGSAFFHAQQPQAGSQHRLFPERGHIKSNTVVTHKQMEVPI